MKSTAWKVTLLLAAVLCLMTACGEGEEPADTSLGGTANSEPVISDTADGEGEPEAAPPDAAETEGETRPHVHAFGDWVTVIEATCQSVGQRERICACGEVESEETEKTAHTRRSIPTVQPTMTENGSAGGIACGVCGEVLREPGILPYTGHSGFAYETVAGQYCVITGRGTCDAAEVYIPSSIDGYPVMHIGEEAFLGDETLTAVILPHTMNTIESTAFACCVNLKTVEFPDSLMDIYPDAFAACTSLTRVELPDGMLTLRFGLFNGCTALTEVVFPERLQQISPHTFAGCSSLTRVILPETVSSLGSGSFDNCQSLTAIYLPASLREMDGFCFYGCEGLTDIYFGGTEEQWTGLGARIPDGVTVHFEASHDNME